MSVGEREPFDGQQSVRDRIKFSPRLGRTGNRADDSFYVVFLERAVALLLFSAIVRRWRRGGRNQADTTMAREKLPSKYNITISDQLIWIWTAISVIDVKNG